MLFVVMSAVSFGGTIGLPVERLAMPVVSGDHLVCIWDAEANAWLQSFEQYDHAGTYDFKVPEWGRWYWVGLWDSDRGEYVFGKWIGYFSAQ